MREGCLGKQCKFSAGNSPLLLGLSNYMQAKGVSLRWEQKEQPGKVNMESNERTRELLAQKTHNQGESMKTGLRILKQG